MKRMIYLLVAAVLATGCDSYFGGIDDSRQEYTQFVIINRSSMPIEVSIEGADWIQPQDTIRLKPVNGVFKDTSCEADNQNYSLHASVMKVNFDNGVRSMCLDHISYNGLHLNYWIKYLNDTHGNYSVVEFSDKICDSLFKHHDELRTFRMMDLKYPTSCVQDSLAVKGSSEAWFSSLFATSSTREKLRLGAVVHKEAASMNDIMFMEEYDFVPDSIDIFDIDLVMSGPYEIKSGICYYGIENLRKFGLAHFSCDFASLTGRRDGEMEKFCGLAFVSTYIDHIEVCQDRTPEEFRNDDGSLRVIKSIDYGNIMILLAEADCSEEGLRKHLGKSSLGNTSRPPYNFEPEVQCHLITLDRNGEFTCRSGGTELAEEYDSWSGSQDIHPISFELEDPMNQNNRIHIPDVNLSRE